MVPKYLESSLLENSSKVIISTISWYKYREKQPRNLVVKSSNDKQPQITKYNIDFRYKNVTVFTIKSDFEAKSHLKSLDESNWVLKNQKYIISQTFICY